MIWYNKKLLQFTLSKTPLSRSMGLLQAKLNLSKMLCVEWLCFPVRASQEKQGATRTGGSLPKNTTTLCKAFYGDYFRSIFRLATASPIIALLGRAIAIRVIYSITLIFAINYSALAANKNPPIKLSSDKALCKYQKNETVCIYTGNAKFTQRNSCLQAKKIALHKTGNKIKKIVASGEDSSYSTTANDQKQITARANLITIYLEKNTMILEQNGQLIVGKDRFNGPHITYEFKQKLF